MAGGGHILSWNSYRDGYRRSWERGHPMICWMCWDLAEHAFRYGWEMAQDSQFMADHFADIEETLRQRWPQYDRRYHQSQIGIPLEHCWDDVYEAIRQGWECGRKALRRKATHHDA